MSSQSATALTSALLDALQARIRPHSYATWFRDVEVQQFDTDTLHLGVPNLFVKNWIEKNYLDTLREAAREVTGTTPMVQIAISALLYQARRQAQQRETASAIEESPATPTSLSFPTNEPPRPVLRADWTLGDFITDPGNRIAHAACERAVAHPGDFNPLVLYGGHGLGKTHLLHGIGHAYTQAHPQWRIEMLSATDFVHAYTHAHANRTLSDFRKRFRECKALLVDDIQALSEGNKTATIREFLHTLDTLTHRGAQVVLTADRAPKQMRNLPDALLTRMISGLVAQLEPPRQDARRCIIESKAAQRELTLPAEVLETLANREFSNVRELEGAIGRLAAMAKLGGVSLAAELVSSAVGNAEPTATAPLPLERIVDAVAVAWSVKSADLRGRKRARMLATARKAAMRLARTLTRHSLSEIGAYFGRRSHSTVLQLLRDESIYQAPDCRKRIESALCRLGVTAPLDTVLQSQGSLFDS